MFHIRRIPYVNPESGWSAEMIVYRTMGAWAMVTVLSNEGEPVLWWRDRQSKYEDVRNVGIAWHKRLKEDYRMVRVA